MSKWRRLAIELFPERRRQFQHSETTYYQVFFDLQLMVKKYHEANNIDGLRNTYGFAEWCWQQLNRSPDLANAAAVAFYEHLIDSQVTLNAIPTYLKPKIFEDMMPLFKYRYHLKKQESAFEELVLSYNRENNTSYDPATVEQR